MREKPQANTNTLLLGCTKDAEALCLIRWQEERKCILEAPAPLLNWGLVVPRAIAAPVRPARPQDSVAPAQGANFRPARSRDCGAVHLACGKGAPSGAAFVKRVKSRKSEVAFQDRVQGPD